MDHLQSRRAANHLCSNRLTACLVILLLTVHASLLAYSAAQHSPTLNEPGHLVAGLAHWKFARFEVYRVDPPLVHYVSALPVMLAGYVEDWTGFYDTPGARPEYKMGENFISANGERSLWLFTLARWGCIPFSVLGGLFCCLWSRELWRSNAAGLLSLCLWCFDPNILAHGELITPDAASAAMGLGAAYLFWRWLRKPAWGRALAAGCMLGVAELTKTMWIVLFGLWPLLWLYWSWSESRDRSGSVTPDPDSSASPAANDRQPAFRTGPQLICILLAAIYIVNGAYRFEGTFTRVQDYSFISSALTGSDISGTPGNRFAGSVLGGLPIPFPREYVLGIDTQKHDLEDYDQRSYLRGEWKDGGWWYYYLYGLLVKVPLGTQALLLLAAFTIFYRSRQADSRRGWVPSVDSENQDHSAPGEESAPFVAGRNSSAASLRDLVVLLAPPLTILVLVSSQLEFNHHVRYVLPLFGFALALIGVVATRRDPDRS